jgi:predicted ATPase
MRVLDAKHYLLDASLKRDQVDSFDEYLFCIPAFRNLETLKLHPAVTFFIGENGSGKSTLLEAIAVASGFNPEGGTKNFGFSTRLTRLVFLVQWKVSLISPSFCLIQGADVAKRSQFPERIPPVFCR